MAGRWSDEHDWRGRNRSGRDRDDRDEWYGADDERGRLGGREDRSWGDGDRDRVFGERDYGAGYNRPPMAGGGPRDWQDRDYGGVSPAMRRGAYGGGGDRYGRGRQAQGGARDYTHGGRYYGDDARQPIYREEYGMGGREYGDVPRGYDEGRRFGSREADDRWAREMRQPVSGGTGGYDYERGYGDAGRGQDHDDDGLEARAREAGEFFRRTGRRVSEWFRGDDDRSYRGLGPKGYQRSDERISEEVHQHLTEDSWLDATHIGVSVSGGEVTLSGTVEDRESKHRAERLIENVGGVKHVQNNLRVDGGSFFTRPTAGYGDSAQEARMRSAPTEGVDGGGQGDQGRGQASASTSEATRTRRN